MTFEQVKGLLLAHSWQFAKTMPETPHWYTLRKKWENEADFEAVVIFIRENGYKKQYGKTTYIYLDIDDHKYWTMGDTIPRTILINRAVLT